MPEVPFFRLSNENLDVTQKAQFGMAVKDGIARGISIAETAKRFGLGKNAHSRYKKQIEKGTCTECLWLSVTPSIAQLTRSP